MNRIVKFILTAFFICLGVFASAQDYIVKSLEIIPDDIDARVNSRVGNNGRKCALLKVYVQDGINHVNGSVVGDIETKGMEKRIYLAHDSKQVELVFENHFPLRIKFDDYNIPVVTEQTVYVLKLTEDGSQAPQNGVNNSNIGHGVGRDFVETAAGLNMDMVYVAGGTFMMGASASDSEAYDGEKPAHNVTLSGYYIGKYEVTQKQWVEIMGSNPSCFKGDNLPVERVSWNDVQEFIRKLNAKTGKNYRLPTEAEWEFAARSGNNSSGCKYSGSNSIDEVAWYYDNSNSKTHTVGTKSPNELGIYDMTGNVLEWCSDWYGENYYDNSPSTNPKGPSSGAARVLRGCSCGNLARICRVSSRACYSPGRRIPDCGFRLAMDAK